MGGSGVGGPWVDSSEDLRKLEQLAKDRLRESEAEKRHNVFISFASCDLSEVNLLRGQAKNENSDIEFNDWSVKKPFDSEDAEYIKRGIRERIRRCSVTIVYLSNDTAKSKWVEWEIKESIAMGKGVVAMHQGPAPPTNLPSIIGHEGIRVVSWNQRQLATAVEDEATAR